MLLHLVVILGFFTSLNRAATPVGGVLLGNTVWTTAGGANPYQLTKDVQVPRNVTLTIQPGVIVDFGQGDFEILVKGFLKVQGSATQRVVFQRGSATDLKYMIKFQSTNLSLSNINYARFSGPKSGLQIIDAASGSLQNTDILVVQSSIFENGSRIGANGNFPRNSFPSVASMELRACFVNQTIVLSANANSEPIRIINSNILNSTFWPRAGNEGVQIDNCIVRNMIVEHNQYSETNVFRLNNSNAINTTVIASNNYGYSWLPSLIIVGKSIIHNFTYLSTSYMSYGLAQKVFFEDSTLHNVSTTYQTNYYWFSPSALLSIFIRNCQFTLGNLTVASVYNENSVSIVNSILNMVNISTTNTNSGNYYSSRSLTMRNVSFQHGQLYLPYHQAQIVYSNITVHSPLTIGGNSYISCSMIGRSSLIPQNNSTGLVAAGLTLTSSTIKNFGIGLRVTPPSVNTVTISATNFHSNLQYNIENKGAYNVTATSNYWGTNNAGVIINKINDYWDDINYGEVIYNNYVSSALPAETGCAPYDESSLYQRQTTNSPYPWGK